MNDYIRQAISTEAEPETVYDTMELRLLHAGMGLCTEAAEFLDVIKKSIFYGKEIDFVNLKEELGDMQWYMAIALDELNTTFEEVQAMNISKLKLRYPQKFSSESALNRDLEKERADLELKSYTQAVVGREDGGAGHEEGGVVYNAIHGIEEE